MVRRNASLTPLKDVLGSLFREGGLPFNLDDVRIWQVWKDAVGAVVARHARPSWIKEHRLRVTVSDPVWLQELRFQEQEIREKLNQHLGKEVVAKIEFRMGS
jgi:predicted nucleic acid-binding Zn ribbon protein